MNQANPICGAARHIYVHVPFCSGKCTYCGFYSVVNTTARSAAYLRALEIEFQTTFARAPSGGPLTIYFGGGTPSVLSAAKLRQLCAIPHKYLDLTRLQEWSVEANPGTLSMEKIGFLKECGVNRISLGVQSLNDSVLKVIGRRHNSRDVADTVKLLRRAGIRNVGIDLIAGLPGENTARWNATIDGVLQLDPEHISIYALSIDPCSKLAMFSKSELEKWTPSENGVLEALDSARTVLCRSGFTRYEISNYAKPGCECQHNLAYWRGLDYLGFGPAASSRAGFKRWTNRPDLNAYLTVLPQTGRAPNDSEILNPERDKAERLMFAFRLLNEGVDLSDYGTPGDTAKWEFLLSHCVRRKLLRRSGRRWLLTKKGSLYADHVARDLLP